MTVFRMENRKCVSCYCTIPKAASHSIRLTVRPACRKFHEYPKWDSDEKLFKWTVVRNPYSRAYSAWYAKVRYHLPASDPPQGKTFGSQFFHHTVIPENVGFETFVDIISDVNDEDADQHFRSQSAILRKNNFEPDRILKLENLPEEWPSFAVKIGVPTRLLVWNNSRGDITNMIHEQGYTPELRRKVFKRYQEDFETFGYDPERL